MEAGFLVSVAGKREQKLSVLTGQFLSLPRAKSNKSFEKLPGFELDK